MKKTLLTLALCVSAMICGAQSLPQLNITDVAIDHTADKISLAMTIHPADYSLKTNTQWVVTPVIRANESADSVMLKPFIVTGKNAYYYAQRQGLDLIHDLIRSGKGSSVSYTDRTAFLPWMNNSTLGMQVRKISCCGESPKDVVEDLPVADLNFTPPVFSTSNFAYVVPIKAVTKERALSGRAYVNFIVNKTNIVPTYMNNAVELRKILSSIDSVRNNPDATVDTILLTGYASPEGAYSNNVRLAEGRVKAVKEYVMSLYDFPAKVYKTNSVPEDWDGLREYIAASNLADKEAMIAFIDNPGCPIAQKNDKFRQKFPKQYPFLLQNEYPWLRHTDYYIHYVIKQYTTLDEIKEALERDPRNLSLNEFFTVARSYPENSPEFCDILEQAAAYYPSYPEANLNAANAAMSRGELDRARRYLAKAGASPEAEYARGILDALNKDYESAANRFRAAKDAGVTRAADALEQVEAIINSKEQIRFRR
ncbi:MAG: DUF3868 domain-containing protein [Muribaculaceae bacterium]|nr:DUF3868 domain-containing protein [Muribaculaceae bacterium]